MRQIVGVVMMVAALAACSGEESGMERGDLKTAPIEGRPSMEEMQERYQAFQADVTARLDAIYGSQEWQPVDTEAPRGIRAGCTETDEEGFEKWSSPGLRAWVTPTAEQTEAVKEAVIEAGKEAGFVHVVSLIDRPGELGFDGYDTYEGYFTFYAVDGHTTIGTHTGCHQWAVDPGVWE
jgi:hypothetical protein